MNRAIAKLIMTDQTHRSRASCRPAGTLGMQTHGPGAARGHRRPRRSTRRTPSPTRSTSGRSRASSPTARRSSRPTSRRGSTMSTDGSQIAAAETAPHVPRRIDEFLTRCSPKGGSDLHFVAGDPPRIRLYGELQTLRDEPLDAGLRARGAAPRSCRARRSTRLEEQDGADFAYTIPGVSRFRVNVFRHIDGLGARVPRHPVQGAHARPAQHAGVGAQPVPRQQRPDPGHRQDRLGQVDHARGDDRRHQRAR